MIVLMDPKLTGFVHTPFCSMYPLSHVRVGNIGLGGGVTTGALSVPSGRNCANCAFILALSALTPLTSAVICASAAIASLTRAAIYASMSLFGSTMYLDVVRTVTNMSAISPPMSPPMRITLFSITNPKEKRPKPCRGQTYESKDTR